MNNLEEVLRESFCKYKSSAKNTKLYIEVPVFSRSVDLVELADEELYAIEFKIRDWKRALSQLKNVESCFDYLVLCIPKPKTEKCRRNIIMTCESLGIGLYFWDQQNDQFVHECQEKCVRDIWQIQKRQTLSYLEKQEVQNG